MDELTRYVKEAFEPKLGRPMPDEEAADFAMHLRRFAAFLIDCSKDEVLMDRLGLRKKAELPRAAPRVADSTTQGDGNPPGAHLPALAGPPTGSSRDVSSHRDSSASQAVTSAPAVLQAQLTAASTVHGSS